MFQTKDNAIGNIKYVGISRAVVIDNNDPLKRGRVRVNSPVLGETNWISYLTTPGTFNVPAKNTVVYIQCDGGFYTHPVAWGNLNYGDDDDLQFPEEFQRISPTNRGIYTPGGLLLEIDDGTDPIAFAKRGVRLSTKGETKIDLKDETVDKSFDFKFSSGTHIKIDSVLDSFIFETAFGDTIEISRANGIQQTTPALGGTLISQNAGKIDIESTLDSTYTATQGSITIQANGTLSLISDTGSYELTALTGDITLTASAGAVMKLANGKVGIGGPSAELLDLFDQELDSFINNASTLILTAVGPGVLNPSVVSLLTNIKILLTTIKGGI